MNGAPRWRGQLFTVVLVIKAHNAMSPARQLKVLQKTDFDRLLSWLDPNPERAGELYEKIRWRLIAVLASRGCRIPEELADETIDRVARRVADIEATYVGDKSLYFLGVMNNVHHEYLKRPRVSELSPPEDSAVKEQTYACLDKCVAKLTPHAREIIEKYYAADKRAKINLRKRIAAAFGISNSNLRLRALRIRAKLQVCIERCLEASETRPSGRVPLC
jgi:DNA-directed RNA polymerase specialized sigma24 family protein